MATKTDGMDKLKDSGQTAHAQPGRQGPGHRQRQVERTDRQAHRHRRRWPGRARPSRKAGEASVKGDNPVMGGLKGAASGIKDKITGGGGKGGGGSKATKSTNIVETIDVGVPAHGRLQPVDRVRRLPQLHEEGRRASRRHDDEQDQLQGPDLPQPPRVGGDDHRADPRRAHRVALEGAEGPRRRRGHLPRARAEPDPHPGRPRVLPAGPVREDRQHLARPRAVAPGPRSATSAVT